MMSIKTYVTLALFLSIGLFSQAQCEIFKSEITEVQAYMKTVSKLADSIRPMAEIAAFDAQFSKARSTTKTLVLLVGMAVDAAYEATTIVAEAQYNSQLCGLDESISNAVDAESHSIDARDFAEQAYENTKMAANAKDLGNLQFYMRKAQQQIRNAQDAADVAAIAAELAHYSCSHDLKHTASGK